MARSIRRCDWCGDDPLYVAYHDEEWGLPRRDEDVLFEFLLLEGAQAGLSWITILRKRENYRQAMDGFDASAIARYDKRRVEKLLRNEGIIRNRLKIESAINNARRYLEFAERGESFSEFIWSFTDGRSIQNRFKSIAEVPATTQVSDAMSKALKKKGFNFVGSTICYAYMQSIGMVNDHLTSCFRHKECRTAQ
ncbi:MAG: DNA-3-methyladenine glycosylase I [Pseudomonadales bacterium]|nr:DNA-3-methyladenine glycosylase I [Pseudomonadales bacterium]